MQITDALCLSQAHECWGLKEQCCRRKMKLERLHLCGQRKGEMKENRTLTWEQYIEPGLRVHCGSTSL